MQPTMPESTELLRDRDEQLEHDYRTIYFPAQQLHVIRDAPRERAGLVVLNDDRLAPAEHVSERVVPAA